MDLIHLVLHKVWQLSLAKIPIASRVTDVPGQIVSVALIFAMYTMVVS